MVTIEFKYRLTVKYLNNSLYLEWIKISISCPYQTFIVTLVMVFVGDENVSPQLLDKDVKGET